MSPCVGDPLFTFYLLDHRTHALAHPTSFDHFGIGFSVSRVPISMMLQFPLWRFSTELPINYWLCPYQTHPVCFFLRSLPLLTRLTGSYARHLYYLFRLYREVFAEGILSFIPLVPPWMTLHPLVVFHYLNLDALRLQAATSQL